MYKKNGEFIIRSRELDYEGKKVFDPNNRVWISGVIEKDVQYSHEIALQKIYKFMVAITRNSGVKDIIPVYISEHLLMTIPKEKMKKGNFIEIGGQYRSYNDLYAESKSHLKIFVFAKHVKIYDEISSLCENYCYLNGFVCKKPNLRETPLGRTVTDIMVAVNCFGKSFYIPCIAWGINARWANDLDVGDRIELYGRIQSREYLKNISENVQETKTAYELSISAVKKVEI